MGARIRVIGDAWPERVGAEGQIADDPGDGIYPFGKRDVADKSQVVILLDDDPLVSEKSGRRPRGWTCCLEVTDVEFL